MVATGSGSSTNYVFTLSRGLQGEMMQLMGSLESRNAEFSAVIAEKEKLTSENQQLKANEEGLHCLLREKDKENTELQQDYDRQCQHLMNVKAFVVVSGMWLFLYNILITCCMQAVYNFISAYIIHFAYAL